MGLSRMQTAYLPFSCAITWNMLPRIQMDEEFHPVQYGVRGLQSCGIEIEHNRDIDLANR